jgi:hypothetical protein
VQYDRAAEFWQVSSRGRCGVLFGST